ncbi:MAG TPA: hypothetical protein PLX89_07430 [Verrucomicrobiota bacterium]|nr:hypothetical protein [Verrucomicrobiales bacterium]HRI12821.1 hypothetical protein [Verrucomicrobiota bacterium]
MTPADGNSDAPGGDARFPPTRWTRVLNAQNQDPEALNAFCQGYWYPVYAHFRRRGLTPEDAQDRTQDVFVRLSKPDALNGVSADRGRFRTLVLACADHELSRWRAGMSALKRGGGEPTISYDQPEATFLLDLEVTSGVDSTLDYDRDFATNLVRQVLKLLQREYQRIGQGEIFETLGPLLTELPEHGGLVTLAERLKSSEGHLRVRLHRLRHRFAELLLEEVAQTVANPAEARAELSHLLAAFATT